MYHADRAFALHKIRIHLPPVKSVAKQQAVSQAASQGSQQPGASQACSIHACCQPASQPASQPIPQLFCQEAPPDSCIRLGEAWGRLGEGLGPGGLGRLVLSTVGLSGEAWEAWGGLENAWECFGEAWGGLGRIGKAWGGWGEVLVHSSTNLPTYLPTQSDTPCKPEKQSF